MLLFLLFSGDSPVHHLDSIIDHWIYKTPGLIDNAVEVSNKDNRFTVTKRVSQVYFHYQPIFAIMLHTIMINNN